MAGWYGVTGGDVTKVNTDKIGSNSGIGLKAFGDAFSNIGKTMQDKELNDKKMKLYDSQLANEKIQQQTNQLSLDNAFGKTTQEAIDTAYLSNLDDNGQFDDMNGTIGVPLNEVSIEAKEKADTIAQKKFNETAIKKATEYKTWDAFSKANPELVENADGTTAQSLKKAFDTTKTELSTLKTQKLINDLNSKVDKKEIELLKEKSDKKFKYTQETGTKITNLVKAALGMDKDSFDLDAQKQKDFENMVTEISTISKEYSLEPNLAYKLWIEKASKKVEEKTPTPTETKPTWENYLK